MKIQKLHRKRTERKRRKNSMRKGEIYWMKDIYQTVGNEIDKTRPVLVVSSDNLNEICIILYMTTHPRDTGGARVQIESDTCGTCAGSTVLCDQIRTVSQTRLEEDSYIGRVSEEELQAIEKGLLETLGIY